MCVSNNCMSASPLPRLDLSYSYTQCIDLLDDNLYRVPHYGLGCQRPCALNPENELVLCMRQTTGSNADGYGEVMRHTTGRNASAHLFLLNIHDARVPHIVGLG